MGQGKGKGEREGEGEGVTFLWTNIPSKEVYHSLDYTGQWVKYKMHALWSAYTL